jgi:succinate dehydrogenase/fumarate reductase flavoprotein subunit
MAIPIRGKLFERLVRQRPIAVLFETPARELIQRDGSRDILGVRARRGNQSISVKARKAVVLTCGGFENNQAITQGGPRRNERAQIVRPDGTPIGRLYSAGELGSIYSYLYQGTGNIGECLAFGRVAGRNAAAETPWV